LTNQESYQGKRKGVLQEQSPSGRASRPRRLPKRQNRARSGDKVSGRWRLGGRTLARGRGVGVSMSKPFLRYPRRKGGGKRRRDIQRTHADSTGPNSAVDRPARGEKTRPSIGVRGKKYRWRRCLISDEAGLKKIHVQARGSIQSREKSMPSPDINKLIREEKILLRPKTVAH